MRNIPTAHHSLYERCTLCPRRCGVNRAQGEVGFCGETSEMRVAWAGLHRGEEPPVSGAGGSGAVFFTGCTLGCSICQNRQISREGAGAYIVPEKLADIWTVLKAHGAENINLITGAHFLPGILETARILSGEGDSLPLVWNTSGFECRETLELLHGMVDIYLTDVKTLDRSVCRDLALRADYPGAAVQAACEMAAAVPLRVQGEHFVRGVIVRHLVLPEMLESTRRVFRWFSNDLAGKAWLSVMFQYAPVSKQPLHSLNRRINREEYETVLQWLDDFGIQDGFFQDLDTGNGGLPDFSRKHPFSGDIAETLWSYLDAMS